MEPSPRQGASKGGMRTLALLSVIAIAACGGADSSDRARRFAADKLKTDPGSLRVTSQSDLDSERFSFHLVTSKDHAPLVVVVPHKGDPFDGETEDAFGKVTRAEDAPARLSRIGAERIALWFGALGGKRCPMPASDTAHFASVETLASGVRISYPVGETRCEIDLGSDGSLVSSRLVEQTSTGPTARAWKPRS